jgi:hypothetical protein
VVAGSAPGLAVRFAIDEPNEQTLSIRGTFLARYAPDGDLRWVRAIGPGSSSSIRAQRALRARPDGSILLSESYSGSVTFGAGLPTEVVLDSLGGNTDSYVAVFNADGDF